MLTIDKTACTYVIFSHDDPSNRGTIVNTTETRIDPRAWRNYGTMRYLFDRIGFLAAQTADLEQIASGTILSLSIVNPACGSMGFLAEITLRDADTHTIRIYGIDSEGYKYTLAVRDVASDQAIYTIVGR